MTAESHETILSYFYFLSIYKLHNICIYKGAVEPFCGVKYREQAVC